MTATFLAGDGQTQPQRLGDEQPDGCGPAYQSLLARLIVWV
jgi:hypothetical protein